MHVLYYYTIPDGCYGYIKDLQAVDQCLGHNQTLPADAMRVTTPLNLDVWEKLLGDHPDKQYINYILDVIEHAWV